MQPPFSDSQEFDTFVWDGDIWRGISNAQESHQMDGTVVLALDQCSPTSLEGVCLQVFKTMTEDMMGDSVDVFLQAQEEFMRRLKEFIPDSRDTIPVIQSELSTDEQIQVLMEVRNELLHESQELLERYKYLSQKIDETWVQYQQLQLKLSQPPQPTQ